MIQLVFSVILFCASELSADALCSCGANEKFSNCNSACPLTCKNLTEPTICTEQCVPGCACIDGYVKSNNGSCVPRSSCFNCKKNEEYSNCTNSCGPSCIENQIRFCPLYCREGCACKKGYLLDSEGKCVELKRCKANTKCGKNEEYSYCGTACPATCDEPDKTCKGGCVRGCFCKKNYVLDGEGKCVKKNKCENKDSNNNSNNSTSKSSD